MGKTLEFRSNQNIAEAIERAKTDQEYRASLENEAPSYQITFVNGDVLALWEFIFQAIRCWLSYFDTNGIPRDAKLSTSMIYIDQSQWGQLV